MQQSLKAGISAATISTVLRIALELYKLLEKAIKNEGINAGNLKNLNYPLYKEGLGVFMRWNIGGNYYSLFERQIMAILKISRPNHNRGGNCHNI
jgi:hypothetical protein